MGKTTQWAIWGATMALVMGWLGRSRMRPDSEARMLAHPRSTLIVGLVCFGLFATIAIGSNVFRNETTTWWTTVVFVGFAMLSAPIVIDYFRARHELLDDGLSYNTLLGETKHFRWSELRAVRYDPALKWFRLETNSADVARLSVMLMGLPELARLLLANAPADAIESETKRVLEATADGRPPSVWL